MKALTKKALRELVRSSRESGYYHNQATGKLWVNCPICKEQIECQDYTYGPGYSRRTTIQMLDAGTSDHIENACSECPKCYALRGEHEEGCEQVEINARIKYQRGY